MSNGEERLLSDPTVQALEAANAVLIDHCFECLRELAQGGAIDDCLIAEYLPRPFLHRYDTLFVQKFLVCLASVGVKLRLDESLLPGSTAEELALHAMKLVALEENEGRAGEMQEELAEWEDAVFEDMDHELLFDPALDGLAESVVGEKLRVARLRFEEWFVPFREEGSVSPYSRRA